MSRIEPRLDVHTWTRGQLERVDNAVRRLAPVGVSAADRMATTPRHWVWRRWTGWERSEETGRTLSKHPRADEHGMEPDREAALLAAWDAERASRGRQCPHRGGFGVEHLDPVA